MRSPMKAALHRSSLALALMLAGCSSHVDPPPAPVTIDTVAQKGIEGANCAGAAPVMAGPDGALYPFPSVVAYFYQVLQAYWTDVGTTEHVIQTWLPPDIENTSEAFYDWSAKSVQIYQESGAVGFTHRYYNGMFGFLDSSGSPGSPGPPGPPGPPVSSCAPALDAATRLIGTLAHVALSQA